MKITDIVHLSSFKRWSCCKGRCSQSATHIHATIKGIRNPEVVLSGRCEKHKSDADFLIEDLRSLKGEVDWVDSLR